MSPGTIPAIVNRWEYTCIADKRILHRYGCNSTVNKRWDFRCSPGKASIGRFEDGTDVSQVTELPPITRSDQPMVLINKITAVDRAIELLDTLPCILLSVRRLSYRKSIQCRKRENEQASCVPVFPYPPR